VLKANYKNLQSKHF